MMDPEQFEIHISDNEVFAFPENGVPSKPPESCGPNNNELDLLRASLSDVVLTQSLQLSEMKIDFEDGDDDITKNSAHAMTDSSHTQPEFLMAASPNLTEPQSLSALSQPTEASLEDIAADFEDAVDPPLLTSTLKAPDEDSDDEFDFDLPASKADKGKNVRFSGGCDFEEPAKEAGERMEGLKEVIVSKPEEGEQVGQEGVVGPPVIVAHVGEKGDGTPVVCAAKGESGDGTHQDVKVQPEQEEGEREDRRHIITSSAEDWDNVETVEAGFTDARTGAESMTSVPPLLSFAHLWQHFRTMDHSAVKDKIHVTVEKKGLTGIISRLFGPPRLHKDLHADRELLFCIAATAFDNGDTEHIQSLQTIYRVLTGSRFNCPRYGSHWEEIGFQGRDPATDLRGTGMLALVQLVSFLQDDSTAQIARDLYKLALHPTQNFPFCVMCINISRITLQALRDGALNRECNSQKRVMAVMNQFYGGTLLYLYRVWQPGKTISDSGFVIRDVETRAKKHSKEVFRDLQTYITNQKTATEGPAWGGPDPEVSGKMDENVTFFSVVKSETKSAAELY